MTNGAEKLLRDEVEVVDGEEMLRSEFGNLVRVDRLRPETVLADQTARAIVSRMRALSEHVAREKQAIFDDIEAYQALVFERYGARLGGRRGGITITAFGDRRKVAVQSADYSRVTAALPAAQALMNEILDDLTGGADADLRTLIQAAFERDERTGRVNIQRLASLKRLNLRHPKWEDAKRAIEDAIEPAGSKLGIRAYTRASNDDAYEQIVVDFSRL